MPLSAIGVQNLKPGAAPFKKSDGAGLYVLVQPNGSKLWRMAYRFAGKQKTLALGAHPEITLAEARERTRQARLLLRDGTDPGESRKQRRHRTQLDGGNTFESVARALQAKRANEDLSESAHRKDRQILDGHVYPALGSRPIMAITAPEILTVIRRCEARGHYETAHRMRSTISRVFRFAIANGMAERDPAADLKDALVGHSAVHHAALFDPRQIGGLMRAMRGYENPVVRVALLMQAYTFVRPGELRAAEWQEIDGTVWRIPDTRMKMNLALIVPLAPQVRALLDDLREMTGGGRFLFPSAFGSKRCMSDATVNAALRRMGFTKDMVVGHGMRRTASTVLNESGLWNTDAIERQLAHVAEGVRGIYNAAQYLDERTRMMTWYADKLDEWAG